METDTSITTMTPDEFVKTYAPNEQSATPTDYFIRNKETGKLELHFEKSTYDALTGEQRKDIKSNFLWGRNSGCWISRAKEPNLYHAIRCATSIGLKDAGSTGERLSFAEQQQRKAERAERRADRFEYASEQAEKRGEQLQKPINDMHGDIAFFTQPNINSSAGRAFTRRRERMWQSFERGFDEFRKSEYYKGRAAIARRTAEYAELTDPAFIMRRIGERESDLRKLKKSVEAYESYVAAIDKGETPVNEYGWEVKMERAQIVSQIEVWLDRVEVKLDELGYYQEALEAIGGVKYNRENIKPGYTVKVQRFGNVRVLSVGPKNFTAAGSAGLSLTHAYAEITEIVSAQEEQPQSHPFKVGESFKLRDGSTHTIMKASAKTVTLQSDAGKTYRATPKYRPIPAARKYMWCLMVGSGAWASDIIYRE